MVVSTSYQIEPKSQLLHNYNLYAGWRRDMGHGVQSMVIDIEERGLSMKELMLFDSWWWWRHTVYLSLLLSIVSRILSRAAVVSYVWSSLRSTSVANSWVTSAHKCVLPRNRWMTSAYRCVVSSNYWMTSACVVEELLDDVSIEICVAKKQLSWRSITWLMYVRRVHSKPRCCVCVSLQQLGAIISLYRTASQLGRTSWCCLLHAFIRYVSMFVRTLVKRIMCRSSPLFCNFCKDSLAMFQCHCSAVVGSSECFTSSSQGVDGWCVTLVTLVLALVTCYINVSITDVTLVTLVVELVICYISDFSVSDIAVCVLFHTHCCVCSCFLLLGGLAFMHAWVRFVI